MLSMASKNINVLSIAALPVITDGDDTCKRKANMQDMEPDESRRDCCIATGDCSSGDASADLVLIMIDTDPHRYAPSVTDVL